MPAEYITAEKVNNKRVKLSKVLPLKIPFSVQVFVSNVCNFRCCYCAQNSDDTSQMKLGLEKKIMDFEVFKKCINNISELGKLKQLVISGMGEPLLNPNITEMIKYAKQKDIADRVEIVTNASMLSKEMSDGLIEAGVDRLRISIQGISKEDYKRVSNIDIDYERFIENLKYFYKNKTETQMYIKIIDEMLKDNQAKEQFFQTYKDICDEISVEYLTPPPMECELNDKEFIKSRYGCDTKKISVCALPFYSFIVNCDAQIYPCCVLPFPPSIGNACESLKNIWNTSEHKKFLIKLLKGEKNDIPICCECDAGKYVMTENDYLDDSKQLLLDKYLKLD